MEQRTGFDFKTVMAVVLMGVILVGWQKYMAWKYPQTQKSAIPVAEAPGGTAETELTAQKNKIIPSEKPTLIQPQSVYKPVNKSLENQWWTGVLDFEGFSLRNILDRTYTDKKGLPLAYLEEGEILTVIDPATSAPALFLEQNASTETWSGVTTLQDGTEILRVLELTENGEILVKTTVRPSSKAQSLITLWKAKLPDDNASFLNPSGEFLSLVTSEDGSYFKNERISDSSSFDLPIAKVFALSSHYFTHLAREESEVYPKLKGWVQNKVFYLEVTYPIPSSHSGTLEFVQRVFAGPKKAEILESIDPALVRIIDFGFFSSIANVLLKLLKFFNGWVNNWGVAIIALTIFVRVLVLPFNILAYRSMQKMQKIQPKLQAIREKHKDDPVTLNKETMELMKREKVNPLGGCLPMLLQMPIFFALYQVLGQAIELYRAPFVGWISDLSAKDPYYVLPVLMGVILFIQHKITPTTLDPVQARIMSFMPVIFTLFTLGLPSGLTLYITVSTFFGVIQQQLFMRQAKTQ